MTLAAVDLDLDVFQGPFDLLLALILREEVDLLEVDLADVVLAYIDHLGQRDELDLEAATEFLVLIAALLELKSRLMLPGPEDETLELEPAQAAEELLARLLEYRRYRAIAEWIGKRRERESGYRYRSAPPPPKLRQATLEVAEKQFDADALKSALAGLLRIPPPIDLGHLGRPVVSLEKRVDHLRKLLASRGTFAFDKAVEGVDRATEAVTLFALLELHKQGEVEWQQKRNFGPITIRSVSGKE